MHHIWAYPLEGGLLQRMDDTLHALLPNRSAPGHFAKGKSPVSSCAQHLTRWPSQTLMPCTLLNEPPRLVRLILSQIWVVEQDFTAAPWPQISNVRPWHGAHCSALLGYYADLRRHTLVNQHGLLNLTSKRRPLKHARHNGSPLFGHITSL